MYKQTDTICKPKRIRLFALIINCTILMKTNLRFSRIVYTISERIWCNKHLRHTTTEKYENNGKGGYFRFILMSLIVLYLLHSTSVLSFYIDVVLTLPIIYFRQLKDVIFNLCYGYTIFLMYNMLEKSNILTYEEHSCETVVIIVNLILEFYLSFAWVAPSGLMFLFCKILTIEFNNVRQTIKDLDRNGHLVLFRDLDGVRQHHENYALWLVMQIICSQCRLLCPLSDQ